VSEAQDWIENDAPFATILDLRNSDEVSKSESSEGSQLLYDWMKTDSASTTRLIPVPILRNVDRFWDVTIDNMPLGSRISATLRTIVEAGALDRAAARYLESQGHAGLYQSMLVSGAKEFQVALNICLEHAQGDDRRPLLLHCQKGKDRTGLLSMLLNHILTDGQVSDETLLEEYAKSGVLLGENQEIRAGNTNNSYIDWNYFRGSPAHAMKDTLLWMRGSYGGSVDGYLDRIGFDSTRRKALRDAHQRQ